MRQLLIVIGFFILFGFYYEILAQEMSNLQIVKANKDSTLIETYEAGSSKIDRWHNVHETRVLDLTLRQGNTRLEINIDELKDIYLCFYNVSIYAEEKGNEDEGSIGQKENRPKLDPVKINSILRIKEGIVSHQMDFFNLLKKKEANLVKKDSVSIIVNLEWLLQQMLGLDEDKKETKIVYPIIPNDEVDPRKQLYAFIYASKGIQINCKSGRKVQFKLIIKDELDTKADEPEMINNELKDDDIDPRQYMTIYEKKSKRDSAVLIWHMKQKADYSGFLPQQEHYVIGDNSILEIHFDKKGLANNINFRGSISLKAIYGSKEIPVRPYFVIGQERESFGVSSIPIKELADNYLRLVIAASKVASVYSGNVSQYLEEIGMKNASNKKRPDDDLLNDLLIYLREAKGNLNVLLNQLKKSNTLDSVQHLNYYRLESVSSSFFRYISSPYLYQSIRYEHPVTIQSLIDTLNTIKLDEKSLRPNALTNYKRSLEPLQDNEVEEIFTSNKETKKKAYLELLKALDRFKRYSEYFKKTDKDTQDAFFSIANITRIDFNMIESKVSNKLNKINSQFGDWDKVEEKVDSNNPEIYNLINDFHQVYLYVKEFNVHNPKFSDWLDERGYNNAFLNKNLIDSIKTNVDYLKRYNRELYDQYKRMYTYMKESTEEKVFFANLIEKQDYQKKVESHQWKYLDDPEFSLLFDSESYYYIRDNLARWAGKRIFDKLVYATIDLKDVEINDKDVLKISLVWDHLNTLNNDDNVLIGQELTTAIFKVDKVGWHLKPTESILFINQLQTNQLPADYPRAVSNFKPMAGASLLWTYYNDHRGQTCEGRFLRWLELSAGLNVTLVDFSNTKDLEIGFGPIIGFFRNQVFITGGYNLSVKGFSPWYMGLGFSFTNISSKLQSKINENETK